MMTKIVTLLGTSFLFVFGPVQCFTTVAPTSRYHACELRMATGDKNEDLGRKAVASFVAAAYILGNVMTAAPAHADPVDFGGSSEILAGRSGGRMGGRSSFRSSPSSYRAPPTNYRSRTTIVTPSYTPPVVVSPPLFMPSPFGLGFGYGCGLGGGGDFVRDYRQDSELAREKAELEMAQQKNAELEARLRQLEQKPAPLPATATQAAPVPVAP